MEAGALAAGAERIAIKEVSVRIKAILHEIFLPRYMKALMQSFGALPSSNLEAQEVGGVRKVAVRKEGVA